MSSEYTDAERQLEFWQIADDVVKTYDNILIRRHRDHTIDHAAGQIGVNIRIMQRHHNALKTAYSGKARQAAINAATQIVEALNKARKEWGILRSTVGRHTTPIGKK